MRSKGLNSNDIFSNKISIIWMNESAKAKEDLINEGYEFTNEEICYRKIDYQGKAVGYQVKIGDSLHSVRTGSEYMA